MVSTNASSHVLTHHHQPCCLPAWSAVQVSVSKEEAVSEASHAAPGPGSQKLTDEVQGGTATGNGSMPGSVALQHPSYQAPQPNQGPSTAAASAAQSAAPATSLHNVSHGQQRQQKIKIVISSTDADVRPPLPVDEPTAGGESNSKRAAADLDDDDNPLLPSSKRSRVDPKEPESLGVGNAVVSAAGGLPVVSKLDDEFPDMHDTEPPETASKLQQELEDLLKSQQLCLVLDLDHTLLNSAKFSEVDREWEYKLESLAAAQTSLPSDQRDLFRLPKLGMWTKLRPGVREFLKRASKRFELWIHTAGNRCTT